MFDWKSHVVETSSNTIFRYYECNYCDTKLSLRINRNYHIKDNKYAKAQTNSEDIQFIKQHIKNHFNK